jgi:hypothetical protein
MWVENIGSKRSWRAVRYANMDALMRLCRRHHSSRLKKVKKDCGIWAGLNSSKQTNITPSFFAY